MIPGSEDIQPLAILVILVTINLVAGAVFWLDKNLAIRGMQRVPEKTLLALALVGGSPAIMAVRHLARHKTRKQPFVGQLYTVIALQLAAILYLAWQLLA